ncbi:MAG: glycerophosphodiester phosphodiesterase [Anaerolineae bacterium]|nr:glycerophosphodiester phosphodiesterase [Anaerolineae bacterium]
MTKPPFYRDQPLVIAHRGARDMAPENTLAAFAAAIDAGADGIELDVTRCASGEIVVIHDDRVDRTTDGSGLVSQLPWAALRELDAGSWFGAPFAGERIPLLEQVFELVRGAVRINVEIKGMRRRGDGLEEEVAVMIARHSLAPWVLISSFNPWALWRIKAGAPALQRGLLYAPGQPLPLARGWARHLVRPHALHPRMDLVDGAYIAWARRQGYRVNVWTVNEDAAIERMIALGVDGIITDRPGRARQLLRSGSHEVALAGHRKSAT